MARQREFNPDDVLEVAINLFWEKGYFDASVDEVVRRSGVAKYGIYGEFGSKKRLFEKALNQFAKDRPKDIQEPIRREGAALPEVIEFFEKAVVISTSDEAPRGCLMVKSGMDLGLRAEKIAKRIQAFFDELNDVMEGCLIRAVDLSQLSYDGALRDLAVYLVGEFRTLLMLSASGSTREQLTTHLNVALRIIR